MERYIPRKSRVKVQIYRNFTIADLLVAFLGAIVTVLIATAEGIPYSIYIALSFFALWCTLFVSVSEGMRMYTSFLLMLKFMALKKVYYKNPKHKADDIGRVIPYTGLNTEKFISFGSYYGMAIEILPMSFFLLTEEKQDMTIRTVENAFQRLQMNQKMTIVKTRMPMVLDEMEQYEDYRYNTLIEMNERGLYNPDELEARSPVFEERLSAIKYLNEESKIIKDRFFIIVYDTDREALESTINGMVASLESSATPVYTKLVTGNDRLVFLKSTFTANFNQRELDVLSQEEQIRWTYPKSVKFRASTTLIDGEAFRHFTVTDYPIQIGNAWMYPLFALEDCRVVVNIDPMDRLKAEKMLDKALMEMASRLNKDVRQSEQIENQTQYDTLQSLLQGIKGSNETLFETNVHIVAAEGMKKEVRAILRQNGFRFTENFGRQIDGFVSAGISRLDTLKAYNRGIQTSSVAAMFPLISIMLQDPRGCYLGYNSYPVFTNFFMRNNERVNSNMVIMGKSGSGKSFATKTLLANFAADNTRVFILDPENEYQYLCENLGGKMIDVGSSVNGIFNPFHIYPTLEDEEGGESDSFNAHLQFLEQFYKLILPGISTDAFEALNSLTLELYRRKNIDSMTNITTLRAKDFPIFDDLLVLLDEKLGQETDQYKARNLQVARTFIEKFASGGRNSNLWNGPSSIETNENFICFNFRSLVNNRNDIVTNAQMLLVFKYLDNEISKNRDFNLKYFADAELEEDHRRIIVTVDEAHVFINKKFPIALDFMTQMAKRIRKYNGMQIIITQNIKDFVGSEEIAQQSTAIINASQYSLIFSLSPNDMTDLIELYRNAGGINKEEQDSIVTARRGQTFLITGPMSRTTVQIEALSTVKVLFENRHANG
ncbi:MAG: ATP-binding protein [Clostridia bacterium]|nr:ATP-binding protein [Clostridia bacterium]